MIDSSTFSANSTGQLDVLGHYGDTFGVDGTQVGVLEQTDQVGFASLLKSQHSGALKPQVGFEILCDFSNETLERQLADQQFGRFLIATDFSKSDGTGPVTVRFLNSPGSRSAFSRRFGS